MDIPAAPLEQRRKKLVVKMNRPEDMKVQEFLSKLKETFSKSSFQQFKEAVTKYKEVVISNITKCLIKIIIRIMTLSSYQRF